MRSKLLLLLYTFTLALKALCQSNTNILEHAAKASGAGSDNATWNCLGTCKVHGSEDKLEFTFNRFRFYNADTGELNDIAGYDGSNCWVENWSGMPHVSGLLEKDTNELVSWVMSGEWDAKDAPVSVLSTSETANGIALQLKVKDGSVDTTLILDKRTYLPETLEYWGDSGNEKWEFLDYKKFKSRTLATKILHHMTQQEETYTFDKIATVSSKESLYRMPRPDYSTTDYSAAPDHTVQIKRIYDYMFVKPLIDGKDIGWFFLDSGADVMCMDIKVAKEQGFKVVGNDITAGVVAVVHLDICRSKTFQLGSTSFKDPTFYELDLAPFEKSFGIHIAGICGYDFIARNVMQVDPKGAKLILSDPRTAQLPSGPTYYPIVFNGETPCVPCGFEGDRSGLFALDTGSSSSVDFFSPAVVKLRLLEGRKSYGNQTGGAGGTSESKQGQVDYFEVGGHRFTSPQVGFQITKEGAFASPYLDGNVGMGFLGNFKIIFDYPDGKMGFTYQ
jgi:Aspartyl protease